MPNPFKHMSLHMRMRGVNDGEIRDKFADRIFLNGGMNHDDHVWLRYSCWLDNHEDPMKGTKVFKALGSPYVGNMPTEIFNMWPFVEKSTGATRWSGATMANLPQQCAGLFASLPWMRLGIYQRHERQPIQRLKRWIKRVTK